MQSAARRLRTHPTEAERLLWRHLRLRQLIGYKFRRQQPLGGYVVDFVCLEKRLIVEVDGGHHAAQVGSDRHRAAWLKAEGFRVLRFWNTEVLQQIEAVQTRIWAVLSGEESPPPQSSPARGEEEQNRGQLGERESRPWLRALRLQELRQPVCGQCGPARDPFPSCPPPQSSPARGEEEGGGAGEGFALSEVEGMEWGSPLARQSLRPELRPRGSSQAPS
jgi:very-short-patch-repair endonuclease